LARELEGVRTFERPKHTWSDTIKTDVKETGMEGGEELASFGLEHKPSGRLL
jgi:hypothetical protein